MNEFTYSDGRREAQAWLAGQLAWERVLADLREGTVDAEAQPAAA